MICPTLYWLYGDDAFYNHSCVPVRPSDQSTSSSQAQYDKVALKAAISDT